MLVQCPKCSADIEANGDPSQPADCPKCGESISLGHEELATQIITAERRPADSGGAVRTEPASKTLPPDDDGRKSRRMQVRCPQCASPIDTGADDSLQDVTCPSCGSNFNLIASTETVGYTQPPTDSIGHFDLVEQVGVGQFGTVWKATDTNLDRTVAVKVPRKGQLSERETEQFLREARAAAQLKHPNIVSVHEVGRADDSVYIVSDFVQGVTLSDWLTGQSLTPREAAELCVKICDALEHAHGKGVVHRDLKPGNIMMTADGEPHIMDFGLAKRETGEITMTTDGQVLGTPAYMSPEQARGDAHSADRRADVYSLGVMLFQLLTGELPFRGNSRMILHQVLHEDAPSPRKLNVRVPRDLETICLKCLEKEPQRRYASAGDVAEELRRFLRGEPLRARPVSATARFVRWCRRKPVLAGLSLTVITLLVIISVAAPVAAWQQAELRRDAERNAESARRSEARAVELSERAEQDRAAAEKARYRARTQTLEAYEHVAESRYSQARVLWNDRTGNRQQQALRYLAEAGKLAGEARQLAASLDDDPESWKQRTEQFWADFTPKLRSEAVRWLTQTSAQELARPPAVYFDDRGSRNPQFRVSQPTLALSPDGNRLAVYRPATDQTAMPSIAFVNTISGGIEKSIPLKLNGSKYLYEVDLTYAPGGKELMVLRRDRIGLFGVTTRWRVQYLNVATGKSRIVSLTGSDGTYFSSRRTHIEFSADRKRVVIDVHGQGSPAEVFSTITGRRLGAFAGRHQLFGLTGDGQRVVLRQDRVSNNVAVVPVGGKWDPKQAVQVAAKFHFESYHSVPPPAVSPDGKWLAVFHTNRPYSSRRQFRLQLYDLETGRLHAERMLHSAYRQSSQSPDIVREFSPEGRVLAVASGEWFYLFAVPDGGLLFSRRHPEDAPNVKEKRNTYSSRAPWEPAAITFAANGARIALALRQMEPRVENGKRYVLQVWDVAAGEVPVKSLAHEGRVAAMAYGRGNAPFVSAGADGILRAWTADGDRKWEAGYNRNEATGKTIDRFDPTGTVFLRRHPNRLDVWNVSNGRLQKQFADDSVYAVSAAGKYLAVRKAGGGVRVYDLAGDRYVATFDWKPTAGSATYAFSPDERHLTGIVDNRRVYIGRISDGHVFKAVSEGYPSSNRVTFSPSGNLAVVLSQEAKGNTPVLVLRDLSKRQNIARYSGSSRYSIDDDGITFSPDERSVAFVRRARNSYNRQWVAVWRFHDSGSMPAARGRKPKPGAKSKRPAKSALRTGVERPRSRARMIGKQWYYTPKIYWPTYDRMLVVGRRQTMSGSTDYFAELWDLTKDKVLAAAEVPHDGSSSSVFFGKSNTVALRVQVKGRRVTDVWDLKTGKRVATFDGRPVQLSQSRKLLLLDPPRLIEMKTGREILKPQGSLFNLSDRFTVNEAGVLTRNRGDQTTLLWQTKPAQPAPGKPFKSFLRRVLNVDTRYKTLPTGNSTADAISPDGRFLVTYVRGQDDGLQVWNLATAKREREIPIHPPFNRLDENETIAVKGLRFSPDGKRLAFSVLGQVRIVDFAAGKLATILDRPTHTDLIRSTAASRDGKLVATASRDGTVCLWHAKSGRFAGMLHGFGKPTVRDVAFSPGGKLLITREHSGRIVGWKLEVDDDAKLAQSIKATVVWQHQAQATRMAVHPSRPVFATGHRDGTVDLRDANTGKPLATLQKAGGARITALDFAPDTERLATVDSAGTLRLWDIKAKNLMRTWRTGSGPINSVAIAARTGLIATAGNGTALWHVDSDRPLTVFDRNKHTTRAVAFSSAGDVLATGGDDHRAHLLDLKQLRKQLGPLNLAW